MKMSDYDFDPETKHPWLNHDDEWFDLVHDNLGEGSPDTMKAWLAKNHPEADEHQILLYVAAETLDNQSDEGGEGWVFDNYVRDVGLFGHRDVDDLYASDVVPTFDKTYDWPHMFHRVMYALPGVQAYAIKSIAADWGLDYDELQLYMSARSFYLTAKHERERKQA